MIRIISSLFGATLLALGLGASAAQTQTRVFVAAQGSDANPCSFATPCRTFQHAHDVVAAGGEIDVLDPAGYGAVIITKAISIQGHGYAGITAPPGNNSAFVYTTAVTINAGANDSVSLHGLAIEGMGLATFGIVFNSGKSLAIENCSVRNFNQYGVWFAPGPNSGSANFEFSNTLVADNGGIGIFISPGNGLVTPGCCNSGTVSGLLKRVHVYNNGFEAGILLDGQLSTGMVLATVTDSVIAHTAGAGITVRGIDSHCIVGRAKLRLTVARSVMSSNAGRGVSAIGDTAAVTLSQSVLIANQPDWGAGELAVCGGVLFGGVVQSYGDNVMVGDGPPIIATK